MALPHLLLWMLLAFASRSAALAQEVPLDASDAAAIKAALGRAVIVHGTLERIEEGKSGQRKVHFKDGPLFLYISRSDYEARAEWKLPEWVGREVFVGGLLKSYFGKIELVVTDPSQIAATLDQVKLPASAAGKNAPAIGTGFAVNSPAAAITQLRLDVSGTKTKRTVKLMSEAMELRWETSSSRSSSSSLLRFEGSSYSTKGREPADQAVSLVTARHGGQWPAARVARMIRKQTADSAGWPTTLTTALLLESTIQGLTLPPGMLAAGRLNPNGTLESGENELCQALRNGLRTILIVPATASPALRDLLLEGSLERLTDGPIFAVNTLDEALTVLQGLSNQSYAPALAALAIWREPLKTRGLSLLRQTEEHTKLEAMLRACPHLLNAQVLLASLTAKPEGTFSINGTANRLFAFYDQCQLQSGALQSDSPNDRKLQKDTADRFAKLRPLCHPKYKSVVTALSEWLDALKDVSRNDLKDTGARAKKARSNLTEATSKVSSEIASVNGEIGLGR